MSQQPKSKIQRQIDSDRRHYVREHRALARRFRTAAELLEVEDHCRGDKDWGEVVRHLRGEADRYDAAASRRDG